MNLYACCAKEMSRLGAQSGEVIIFSTFWLDRSDSAFSATGEVHDPDIGYSGDYAFRYNGDTPDDCTELRVESGKDGNGMRTMTVHTSTLGYDETYRFEMEPQNNLLVQTGGPAKPFTIGNFGTMPLRVETISGGHFTVPCGVTRRLEGTGLRAKKKVLLTFQRNGFEPCADAELFCTDGSWRKLDIIDDESRNVLEINDDGAIVVQLRSNFGGVTILERLEKDPEYELYIRKRCCPVKRCAKRLVEGVPGYGEVRIEGLRDEVVYDFGKLCQELAPEQCVIGFPNVRPMRAAGSGIDS